MVEPGCMTKSSSLPWDEAEAESLRRSAPAALRNREPIAAVLEGVLPPAGLVLELASGSGEHCVHFAKTFPGLYWQPSDPDDVARRSIAAWIRHEELLNVRQPLSIDVHASAWGLDAADALLCINMVHISPWSATLAMLDGASRLLPKGAPLYLYGPYKRIDVPTAESNLAFDRSLKSRDPAWGLRLLDDVVSAAAERGLGFESVIDMPANNVSVIFRRLG